MCTEVFRPIDSLQMKNDLQPLRRHAHNAVALGTNLGYENLSDYEIWIEGENLLTKALLTAIRRYDAEYWSTDTPETIYQYLWRLLYDHEAKQSDMMDVTEEAKKRLDKELVRVFDFINNEYNRRQNAYVDLDEEV